MQDVYVVTHPEATHHRDGLVGGWFDSELTETGLGAATGIAGHLRSLIPSDSSVALFSSDLKRTMQTAEAIGSEFQVAVTAMPELREKSYGEAEGREQAWLDARFHFPPASGDRMNHDEGVEGAETREQLGRRVFAGTDSIIAAPGAHKVIVTHGFATTFVIARWIGMPLEACGYVNFAVGSGSITHLREDDSFHNRYVFDLGIVP